MRLVWGAAAAVALLAGQAEAKVVRVEIERRSALPGTFGSAGAYELITGRFFGELDPKDPRNAIITDLSRAPRNGRGRVEYSATFQIAKPVDMAKASGFLFYNVPNRGNGRAAGDPDGPVRVVSGWQGDIPPAPNLQTATVPVAGGVTGPIVVRFVDMPAGSKSLPIRAGLGAGVPQSHPVSMASARARLIKRRSDDEPGTPVAAADFAFADCSTTPFPGKPDPTRLCVKGGFDPAYAYELRYIAKDPPVLGIGFAATRDLNEFLRYSRAADNPLAGKVKWTIAVGVSQSGNYLRSFTNLGFNQGEGGEIVFDAINPQIAGRHVPLNVRFAVPGGASGMYEPGSEGVLWWGRYEDKARHLSAASLLDRCSASKTCPKVFEIFGSSEFWGLRMSPNLVGTGADRDIALPANVRRYYFPSVTHGGGRGGFQVLPRNAPGFGACLLPANPNPTSDQLRALQQALEDWVAKGIEPPPSVYPTLAHSDLVLPTSQHMGFPPIPGAPSPDGHFNVFVVYDFGPTYIRRDVSGVMSQVPPRRLGVLPSLVPRVDADGNEIAGLKSVQAMVPLGTYLGWNVQARGYSAGKQCGFQGGYIPFAATRAERLANGDPRLSLEERYGTHEGFVAKVSLAAAQLVAERYLLAEDGRRLVADAEASAVLRGR
jgi:hypothetical protein